MALCVDTKNDLSLLLSLNLKKLNGYHFCNKTQFHFILIPTQLDLSVTSCIQFDTILVKDGVVVRII